MPGIVIGTRDTMVNETDMAHGSLASRRYRQVNRQLQCDVISAVLGKSPGVIRRRTQSGPNPHGGKENFLEEGMSS